jgi:hypothetical protein
MLGLRERGMRRPSNERWLWRKYETHTFSHEREYWQEHMPPLSTLLEQRGGTFALDDLILTLQISSRKSPCICISMAELSFRSHRTSIAAVSGRLCHPSLAPSRHREPLR